MKKVLFIGDLRSADNYGAVATSEAMINIIGSIERPFDVKYIDYICIIQHLLTVSYHM